MQYLKSMVWVPIILLGLIGTALAHEAGLEARIRAQNTSGQTTTYNLDNLPPEAQIQSVEVVGMFSTGEPMANAQVSIYAPGEPATPWRTGQSDRQGRYSFTPDLSKRGRWTVRFESIGHSSIINIPVR
ncbi:MAG: carboxypeptidase-like regulatory domain-containing protein [Desertifilum sp.]|nr:carboxypeptidase-like regulatory domain-containing protein [Desertifilum sp.]